jgi:hypothetical protein
VLLTDKLIKEFEVELAASQSSLLRAGEDNQFREAKISRILTLQYVIKTIIEVRQNANDEEVSDGFGQRLEDPPAPARKLPRRRPQSWGGSR